MAEPKKPSAEPLQNISRFISLEEFQNLTPEDRQALIAYFTSYKQIMDRFFVSFEEEQLLIDRTEFEKVHSETLGGILVISGHSGVGKDTAIKRLIELNPKIEKVVTATTRNPRSKEIDGVDYHFLSREAFLMLLEARMFVHRANYADNYYGMPKTELRKRIGNDGLILNIAGEGVKVVKRMIPDTKTVIIVPPSDEAQMERLKGRGTETDEQILTRIKADKELFKDYEHMYDYVIVSENGDVDGVAEQLNEIAKK